MMPVRRDTIRATLSDGTPVQHEKAVYLCEVCGEFARRGFSSPDRKKRLWYCAEHYPRSEA